MNYVYLCIDTGPNLENRVSVSSPNYLNSKIISYTVRINGNESSLGQQVSVHKDCFFVFGCLLILEFLYLFVQSPHLESEIPLDLEREREIGDLASLHDADILKVEFNGQTLICFRNSILPYFKKNACPCKNEYGQFGVEPCSTRVGSSYLHLFTHLSHLEKLFRRYMVFKGWLKTIYFKKTYLTFN